MRAPPFRVTSTVTRPASRPCLTALSTRFATASNRRSGSHGWLLFLVILQKHQFGTSMPQGGHPPHHSITPSAVESSAAPPLPGMTSIVSLFVREQFEQCPIPLC